MSTTTTNFAFTLPAVNSATDEDLWGGYLNDNFTSADALIKTARDRIKRAVTMADNLLVTDRKKILLCDATAAAFTETLLAAATAGDGFEVTIVKVDSTAHAVTIDGSGAETVCGALTFSLTGVGDSITLVSDGVSAWNATGNKTTPSAVPSASTSTQGIVQLAAAADVKAGSSAVLAATPAALLAAQGFTDKYSSTEATYTAASGTGHTFAHGLGVIPVLATAELVCKTTEFGYAVGDRIPVTLGMNAVNNGGIVVSYNATSLNYFIGTGGLQIINATTFAKATLTGANWYVVVRAWG